MKRRSFPHLLQAPLLLALVFLTAAAGAEVRSLDHIVAVVNEDVITQTELERRIGMIKGQLAQRNVSLPPADVLQRQVLDRLLLERLQLQLAERSGIRVDDERVSQVISNIARENRLTLPQFREVLQRDGFGFAEFRENIRNEIMITQLRQRQVENRIEVSDQEIDNQLDSLRNRQELDQEYRLGHILVAVPEAATPDEIAAAREKAEQLLGQLKEGADFARTAVAHSQGQQALEGGDLGWRKAGQLPGIFAEMVARMEPGELGELVRSASGFHIVKLLETRSGEVHIVPQTQARHILIQPNRIVSDSDARRRLETLRRRIVEGGEDFAALAREHSDDKGTASNGGGLGWTSPGQLVPEFEQAMNRLAPGEISTPFRTQFGWHIVQVISRRNQDETEQVQRSRAEEMVRERKLDEALANWLRQLRDEAYVELRLDNA